MEMKTQTCNECGKSFEYEPCFIGAREIFLSAICDACSEAQEARKAASDAKARADMRNAEWERICPPLYRDTDFAKLPAAFQAAIRGWRLGARGIGFFGIAGQCKTRSAFEILRIQHFAGIDCAAVSATKLAMITLDQFSDSSARKNEARQRLDDFRSVRVLLIDDLGKSKLTDRCELELFDILEERTSNQIPTIWTANATAAELRDKMSEDRGDPIMRRLTEFSEIIKAQ